MDNRDTVTWPPHCPRCQRPTPITVGDASGPHGCRECDDRRFPIQAEDVGRVHPRRPAGTVPWSVGVAAWERYAARYGRDQSVERIAERGGFGFGEMHLFLGPSWVEHFEAVR